jgi:hypothetical protein
MLKKKIFYIDEEDIIEEDNYENTNENHYCFHVIKLIMNYFYHGKS